MIQVKNEEEDELKI